ncbi:O-antigen ligase family protein [Microbulbifer variabilis]|uniref:O-antigen ligase family protein n=1 Tax=Microbulbifer variabilis TaxID=266805 RepID=UPI001CFDA21E|nr:O-antigen ligase family protein [Microbulbifer variabilis]
MLSIKNFVKDWKSIFFQFWQRNELIDVSANLQMLGAALLLLYAALFPLASNLADISKTLFIVLTLWVLFTRGRNWLNSPVGWFFAASLLVQVLSWAGMLVEYPNWAESSPKLHRMGQWFLFAAIACWLGGSTRNTLILWLTALIALLLAPWIAGGGFSEWAYGAMGQRVEFGFHNAQHTALLFGVALLGLAVFTKRILRYSRLVSVSSLAWVAAVGICALAVLYTQTRAIWFALAISLLTLLIVYLVVVFRKQGKDIWLRLLSWGAVIGVAMIALWMKVGDVVINRLGLERNTVDALLSGNLESIPYSSIGVRVHSWHAAINWIAERPLLGWGGKGRRLVIQSLQDMPSEFQNSIGHLHNSYLDLLVNYGFLGALVWGALNCWLFLAAYKSWRKGFLPGDFFLFYIGFMVLWLIANCFESYLFYSSGHYIFGIVVAGIVTHIFKSKSATEQTQALSQ